MFQDSQGFLAGKIEKGTTMNNQMRREKLYEILENADRPITGIELSKDWM